MSFHFHLEHLFLLELIVRGHPKGRSFPHGLSRRSSSLSVSATAWLSHYPHGWGNFHSRKPSARLLDFPQFRLLLGDIPETMDGIQPNSWAWGEYQGLICMNSKRLLAAANSSCFWSFSSLRSCDPKIHMLYTPPIQTIPTTWHDQTVWNTKHNTKSGHQKKQSFIFCSSVSFSRFAVSTWSGTPDKPHDTRLLQFASAFWKNKIRFGLSTLLTNLIFQQQNLSLQTTQLGKSMSSTLEFQITLILSELNSAILVVAPLLQLNPSPTVALHQNGLVWSCIRATECANVPMENHTN